MRVNEKEREKKERQTEREKYSQRKRERREHKERVRMGDKKLIIEWRERISLDFEHKTTR